MATKTQATAAFLLLNLMFCTFASGQLPFTPSIPILQCPIKITEVVVCGILINLIKIGDLTAAANSTCCALLAPLTNDEAANCLCLSVKFTLLGFILSVPGDINLILNSCGKNITIGGC
ncbi:unnamed protein product [Spirodela intermedia]|uniref:Hydrophobic seed protein domain-containing protein n=2 Tax=Spirodela intermedia TaxID=51605 RepID=A0A7I8JWJ3_SPIIN|nr:unnamed protein product [Spirodela intermedia]CAA6653795.1 unnamed protein product [Spirodela intermedia]CAA7388184.1 unnamed protein product [Spirodela intermedia]